MNHGVADFNAGREAVGENAAGLALEDRQQLAAEFGVAGIEMQGGGQLAFEAFATAIISSGLSTVTIRPSGPKTSSASAWFAIQSLPETR